MSFPHDPEDRADVSPESRAASHDGLEVDPDAPVIRDKRRIDPQTGQVRDPSGATPAGGSPSAGGTAAGTADPLAAQLAERTADLQRVQADYANYRKRVDRDRAAVAEQALASVLLGLLPVLDDIDRARSHGELEGGVRSITDNLENTLAKLGLERYGLAGEPFDPTVHEALTHGYSPDVSEPTAIEVLQPGYRLGQRILRPARVAVVEPGHVDSTPEEGE
jgi:molecular chaperone GrpE